MPKAADYLRRIELAIRDLDIGISTGELSADFLRGANRALGEIGGARLRSLEDANKLRRAAETLEDAA